MRWPFSLNPPHAVAGKGPHGISPWPRSPSPRCPLLCQPSCQAGPCPREHHTSRLCFSWPWLEPLPMCQTEGPELPVGSGGPAGRLCRGMGTLADRPGARGLSRPFPAHGPRGATGRAAPIRQAEGRTGASHRGAPPHPAPLWSSSAPRRAGGRGAGRRAGRGGAGRGPYKRRAPPRSGRAARCGAAAAAVGPSCEPPTGGERGTAGLEEERGGAGRRAGSAAGGEPKFPCGHPGGR